MNLRLFVLSGAYAICRLDGNAAIPDWAGISAQAPLQGADGLISVTRTADELSIVCAESAVPAAVRCDRGWRCLKVEGPLDLSLTGVLASVLAPLAEARVNILAISTYDTDYILVKDELLACAREGLARAGHRVVPG